MITRIGICAVIAATGCSDSAPSEPTWHDDVAPILAANCVRCHGAPATGGAPTSFRLDRWEDSFDERGRTIFGAGTMAEYIVARTETGEMPPRELELNTRQIDTLRNWFESRPTDGVAPRPGSPSDANEAADIALLSQLPSPLTGGDVEISYEISDAEGDLSTAVLLLRGDSGDTLLDRQLIGGRHTLSIDPGVVAEGSYDLVALVQDHPERARERVLSTGIEVAHAGSNVAPTVTFASPDGRGIGTLISDLDSPFTITVAVDDANAGDTLTLNLEAVRGPERISIAEDLAIALGDNDVAWDTADVPAGSGWNLVASVSDGTTERTAIVERVAVTHGTTSLTWSNVEALFATRCAGCHPGTGSTSYIPGLSHVLGVYDDEGGALGVGSLRGLIYYRMILQRTMPPASASDISSNFQELTEAQRAQIADWLEGGGPL